MKITRSPVAAEKNAHHTYGLPVLVSQSRTVDEMTGPTPVVSEQNGHCTELKSATWTVLVLGALLSVRFPSRITYSRTDCSPRFHATQRRINRIHQTLLSVCYITRTHTVVVCRRSTRCMTVKTLVSRTYCRWSAPTERCGFYSVRLLSDDGLTARLTGNAPTHTYAHTLSTSLYDQTQGWSV